MGCKFSSHRYSPLNRSNNTKIISPVPAFHTTLSGETKGHMAAAQWYAWQMMCPRIEPGHLLLGILCKEVPTSSNDNFSNHSNDLLENHLKAAGFGNDHLSDVLKKEHIKFSQVYEFVYDLIKINNGNTAHDQIRPFHDSSGECRIEDVTPSEATIGLLKQTRLLALRQGTDVISTNHVFRALSALPSSYLHPSSYETFELHTLLEKLCKNPVSSFVMLSKAVNKTNKRQMQVLPSPFQHLGSGAQPDIPFRQNSRIIAEKEKQIKALLTTLPTWPGLGPGVDIKKEVRYLFLASSASTLGYTMVDWLSRSQPAVDLVLEALDAGMITTASLKVVSKHDFFKENLKETLGALQQGRPIPEVAEIYRKLFGDAARNLAWSKNTYKDSNHDIAQDSFRKYLQAQTAGCALLDPSDAQTLLRLSELLNIRPSTAIQVSYMLQLASCTGTSSFRDLVKNILFGWSHKCSIYHMPPQWMSGGGTDDSSKSLCLTFMYALSCLQEAEEREGSMTSSDTTLSAEDAVSLLSMMSSIMHSKVTVEALKDHALSQQEVQEAASSVDEDKDTVEESLLTLDIGVSWNMQQTLILLLTQQDLKLTTTSLKSITNAFVMSTNTSTPVS
ncbi:hypothetical protein CEUSTIGMA_g13348.t1 [Chlamydomonas eustigma]|uniref:Uncharacterized protein n=1 Tax=Chlamydomonas eustigma TaxID=1157962 RepID=A0A250XSM8_9CHLO|nr:hypothetical protein CEUSTIGMA_g13348.t1 [Chlamydomonas eustigma]|eukprot:GAX85932.1 hypothetical protein CEUSTIGMA_g13348.t1 [Chlamydomonas eustigma]